MLTIGSCYAKIRRMVQERQALDLTADVPPVTQAAIRTPLAAHPALHARRQWIGVWLAFTGSGSHRRELLRGTQHLARRPDGSGRRGVLGGDHRADPRDEPRALQRHEVGFASLLAWFWLLTRHRAAPLAVMLFPTPLFGVLGGVALVNWRM
ncbi:MAG: hypothetical protein ACT4P4_22340 [Betaproteobacteria bacterium]